MSRDTEALRKLLNQAIAHEKECRNWLACCVSQGADVTFAEKRLERATHWVVYYQLEIEREELRAHIAARLATFVGQFGVDQIH